MNGLEWLEETVLKENFICDEGTLIISHNGQHFFFSNADKIQEYTGSDLSAEPTDGLKSKCEHITNYWLKLEGYNHLNVYL